jgi:hypothetical protein
LPRHLLPKENAEPTQHGGAEPLPRPSRAD